MSMKEYVRMQLDEAFGPVNRWYCSEYFGYEVTCQDQLLEYYIKHGGAENFSARRRAGKLVPHGSHEHLHQHHHTSV